MPSMPVKVAEAVDIVIREAKNGERSCDNPSKHDKCDLKSNLPEQIRVLRSSREIGLNYCCREIYWIPL